MSEVGGDSDWEIILFRSCVRAVWFAGGSRAQMNGGGLSFLPFVTPSSNRKSKIENRESTIENRKQKTENRNSKIENRKSEIENRKPNIETSKIAKL